MKQEQELAAAERWLAEHPEIESGEAEPMRFDGVRVLTGYEQFARDHVLPWPPLAQRTKRQRVAAIWLDIMMARLRPRYRDLLRRVYFERQTQEEIAQEEGVSQQAINQRVRTAEGALRKAIVKDNGEAYSEAVEREGGENG